MEKITAQLGDGRREPHGNQILAVLENRIFDRNDPVRENDRLQRVAKTENAERNRLQILFEHQHPFPVFIGVGQQGQRRFSDTQIRLHDLSVRGCIPYLIPGLQFFHWENPVGIVAPVLGSLVGCHGLGGDINRATAGLVEHFLCTFGRDNTQDRYRFQ